MRKYIIALICLFGVICSYSSASASTSSALATSTYASELASYFGDEYEPPYGLSNSGTSVSDETGAVVTREVDLALPGKNGLNFEVIRSHNSQNSDEKLSYVGNGNIVQTQVYLYTYTCVETGKNILVSIPYETNVEKNDTFETTANRLARKLRSGNKQHVSYYSSIPTAPSKSDYKYTTIYTYQLNKSVKPIIVYDKFETNLDIVSNTKRNQYISKDLLVSIDYKPRLKMEKIDSDSGSIYGYFRTESGGIYPIEIGYEKIKSSSSSKPQGTYVNYITSDSNEFSYSIDSDIAYGSYHYVDSEHNVEHEKGFSYTFKITARDGKQYYFKSNSAGISRYTEFNVQAVVDKYGNMIDYVNMIDSMGRKIEVTSSGIKATIGNFVQEVAYEISEPVTSDDDPDNYYTFDDIYTLSVYKNEYDGQNILSSKNVTQYEMSKNQLALDMFNSYSCHINSIDYPTSGKQYFEYTNMKTTNDTIKDPHFANIDVISCTYAYENGKKKDNTEYAYTRSRYKMTKLVKKNNSTDVTSTITFDNYERIKTISEKSNSTNKANTYTYTYKDDNYNKNISRIKETKGLSKTMSYGYNRYNEITSTDDGYTKTTSTYDDTYGIILTSASRPINSTKGTLTVNTLTDDGKSIASSDVYEVTYSSATSSTETDRELKSTVKYQYDEYGNVSATVVNDGTQTIKTNYNYTYATDGSYSVWQSVKNVTDADGGKSNVSTFTEYDPLGRQISATDANGNTTTTTYTHNGIGKLVKTTAPDGGISTVSYDVRNNIIVAQQPNGVKTKYMYTQLGNLSKVYVTNDNGAWILSAKRDYDNAMRPKSETVYKNYNGTTATEFVKTDYTYVTMPDSCVSNVRSTDQNGNLIQEISYDYARSVNLKSAHNADVSNKYYNAVTQTVTGDDSITPYKVKTYTDARGLTYKEEVINPTTNKVEYYNTYLYDNSGNLLETKDTRAWNENRDGYTSKTEYDVFNRPVKQYDASGNVSTVEYNSLGQVVSTTDANGNTTTYKYDKLGRNIETTAPLEGTRYSVVRQYYDGNGNVIKTAQKKSADEWNVTVNTYDNMNRPKTTQTGSGGITQYGYDKAGNMTKMAVGLSAPIDITKANINGDYELTTYSYDFKNSLVKATDAMGYEETYKTDMFGNVISKTDRNGNVIKTTYNPFGKVLTQKVTKPDGTSETITNTYDILGNIKSMTDSTGTTKYEYDALNRLTNESKGSIMKLYTYDAGNNRKTFTLKNGNETIMETSYEYDERNLLTSVTNGQNVAKYTYDANGNMLTDTFGNKTINYTYTAANLVKSVNNGWQSYSYGYGFDGNILIRASYNGDETDIIRYTYDDCGRLIKESGDYAKKSYTYDKYSNITNVEDSINNTTVLRTYDKNNHLISDWCSTGEVSVNYYDKNGNIKSKTAKGGKRAVYKYNGFNQLVSAEEDGVKSSYTYDGTGLRQSKTVNGVTTNHIWDGTNMVAETNAAKVTNRYYRGANGIIYADLNGTQRRYFKDGHGNVTGLATMDSSDLEKFYEYDAFGVEITKEESDTNPFRYCGEYYDGEIDKIYLRARYYSPLQGRFMTEDPIRDGLNWYAYCGGNPVNAWDPSGLWEQGDEKYPGFVQKAIRKYTADWEYADANGDEQGKIIANQKAIEARKIGNSIVEREDWGASTEKSYNWVDDKNKTEIVIHHTANYNSVKSDEEKQMKKKNFDGIGYHFIISTDGLIYEGRPLDKKGEHVQNANTGKIGIALVGNFEKNRPTYEQLCTAFSLITVLKDAYLIDEVNGHRDYNNVMGHDTVCPGKYLYDIISEVY